MARQTTLRGVSEADRNGTFSATKQVAGNMTDVMHDIATMVELQAKLFISDGKATVKRGLLATILGAVGISVLVGSIPVALLAISELLVVRAEWDRWVALAASAGGGFVLAAILVGIAWARLRASAEELQPSKEELIQNFQWIKHVFKNRGSAAAEPDVYHTPTPNEEFTHEYR